MPRQIDLNSDVGESFGAYTIGADEEILRWVTSANVACGWHGGDPQVMRRTVERAKALGVAVGAHPSYPDLLGFGRRVMQITRQEARDYLLYQIGALRAFAEAAGLTLQHVKPHGAIYNAAAKDRELSAGIAEAVKEAGGDLIVLGLPESETLKAAQALGLRVAREAFGDRAYNEDGSLVSRKVAGSLITDPELVAERAMGLARGCVVAITGKEIRFQADTICLHGDTPGAAVIARRVRERLENEGVRVRPLGESLGRGASASRFAEGRGSAMEIVTETMGLDRLREMAGRRFGEMVKAVVDVDREIMAIDAELHADEEEALLETGSAQASLWGINLYPEVAGEGWIEFDSMINLRPSQGNRSRGVEDPGTRERIVHVVSRLVAR